MSDGAVGTLLVIALLVGFFIGLWYEGKMRDM